MDCKWQEKCGGCPLRNKGEADYQQYKLEKFMRIIKPICGQNTKINAPIFITDGVRRRAELAFLYDKHGISLGFNAVRSHEIVCPDRCLALCGQINDNLVAIRAFLLKLCQIEIKRKIKSKIVTKHIQQGDIHISAVDNGLDVVIKVAEKIELSHRMLICEFANEQKDVCRISVESKGSSVETIIEKVKPYVEMAGNRVLVAAGTFLQASAAGQNALIDLVQKYIGNTNGKIADLFCGIGTFSYPLARNIKNKITAIDVSAELLSGFQKTINYLSIPNITVKQKNLFKYPLMPEELADFAAVIFDPPRAGAAAQIKEFADVNQADKPQKVVAVSCNPHTFINDAKTLCSSGYELKEITMVDQFVYSEHFELVAFFEKF